MCWREATFSFPNYFNFRCFPLFQVWSNATYSKMMQIQQQRNIIFKVFVRLCMNHKKSMRSAPSTNLLFHTQNWSKSWRNALLWWCSTYFRCFFLVAPPPTKNDCVLSLNGRYGFSAYQRNILYCHPTYIAVLKFHRWKSSAIDELWATFLDRRTKCFFLKTAYHTLFTLAID